MTIGTLFTLFIVPAVYVLIAKDHRRDHAAETPALVVTDEPIVGAVERCSLEVRSTTCSSASLH